MKSLVALLLAIPLTANAGSWFDFEAGVGAQVSRGMGDGTWVQQGVPHSEQLATPAYLAGLTGRVSGFEWHADYVYFGQVEAACLCVPDSAYNPKTHTASERGHIPFSGSGHTQGFAAALGYGLESHGWRVEAEAGPWLYWATWHESRLDPAYPGETNLSHRTVPQLGWMAGARVERGTFSLSYRYYSASQRWNPYPAMVTGTHMLMITKRF
jgi:hypothetical protein